MLQMNDQSDINQGVIELLRYCIVVTHLIYLTSIVFWMKDYFNSHSEIKTSEPHSKKTTKSNITCNNQLHPHLDRSKSIDTSTNEDTSVTLLNTLQLQVVLVGLHSGPGVVNGLPVLKRWIY